VYRVLRVMQAVAEIKGESAAFQTREQHQRLMLFRVESPVAPVALLPAEGSAPSLMAPLIGCLAFAQTRP